jgi:hypothetical protein
LAFFFFFGLSDVASAVVVVLLDAESPGGVGAAGSAAGVVVAGAAGSDAGSGVSAGAGDVGGAEGAIWAIAATGTTAIARAMKRNLIMEIEPV